MKKMKQFLTAIMAAALVIAAIPTALAAGGVFSDVPDGAWYADAVEYVYDNGLMSGTGATTFSPDTATSRAMLATILYRVSGSPAVSGRDSFTDTDDGAWYADAVLWATQSGVMAGYGGRGWAGFCRREQDRLLCRRCGGLGQGQQHYERHRGEPL